MYKLHLILKYLRKRRIAWVSLIAVMMCTAMVIVVISVMGGWLVMFKETFHDITGDIVVSRRSLSGFPYYQEMIDQIDKLPEVAGAAPTLKTYGLINIANVLQDGVQVIGLPLAEMQNVSGFRHSLYRQYGQLIEAANDPQVDPQEKKRLLEMANQPASFDKPFSDEEYKARRPDVKADISNWPGMIVGSGVVGIRKDENGKVEHYPELYTNWAKLTVMGSTDQSAPLDASNVRPRNYWIVDDSRTKVWQYDSNTVYVPFDILQKDLGMNAKPYIDAATGKEMTEPARTNDIRIGLKPGEDVRAVRDKVEKIVDEVLSKDARVNLGMDPVIVQTWQQFNGKFIEAVEHEIVLTTLLFGIISIVAIFLIFCIFYMIVVEKTKDIGIIKSVGATSAGVAGIFLGYGLAIGIVGSFLGLLASYLIVHNINEMHAWLSREMGITVWNAETYAFDKIPNTLDPKNVAIIMAVAVVASVVGSLIPALRAASLHPVEALRWE
jgi:lipoprotein-releasing system permease protein